MPAEPVAGLLAGSLHRAVATPDNTGTYVFEVEPEGVSPGDSKQVAYWSTANGFDTMYSLWNPTAQAEDLTVTFYYGDGSGSYVLPVHLVPNGSTMIDVMMLIESGQPDANGHMFPMTESAGSAIIRNTVAGSVKTASGTPLPAPMTLVAAGGTFNVETATCGAVCITCSGYSNPAVVPNPIYCPVDDSMQCTFQATDCNGNVVNPACTWSSSDTSIMTVDSNCSGSAGNGMWCVFDCYRVPSRFHRDGSFQGIGVYGSMRSRQQHWERERGFLSRKIARSRPHRLDEPTGLSLGAVALHPAGAGRLPFRPARSV